jgi:hypothetical protein
MECVNCGERWPTDGTLHGMYHRANLKDKELKEHVCK